MTTAIAIATPFLVKTGEKIAENIGEEIWKWIKKPFTKDEEKDLLSNLTDDKNIEKLKVALLQKISCDSNYKDELQRAVEDAQNTLNSYNQQNINNQGSIEKQINIQKNIGNIQM